MARGRKKQEPELSTLDAYRNEVTRLKILEKDAIMNLERIRTEIAKFENLVIQEEHKELMEIIKDKGLTFDEVKNMISNIGKNEVDHESDSEIIADGNTQDE